SPVAEDIERKYEQFRQEFTVVYRKTLTLSRELASELSYLEQEAASVLVDGVIEELKEKYPGNSVAEYLEEVRHHLLDNLDPFKEREGEGEHDEEAPDGLPKPQGGPERDPFRVYGVNVILAHDNDDKSPVIFETTPTYANLFGTIQRAYDARGGWTSDFMDLRAGSLLRADGGFLIMYSLEALSEVGVWRALKRTLNHNRLEIQPLEMLYPFDRGAFAAMLEYGVRQAGRRNKVTARFVDIADLAREAHYNAAAAGESVVRAAHVRGALSSKMERHNLIETRIREMIEEGT